VAKKYELGSAITLKVKFDADPVMAALLDTAEQAANELKSASPKRTGVYAQGWTAAVKTRGRSVVVVNQGKQGGISHLLEFGHGNRDGSFAPAITHIAPVAEKYQKIAFQNIKNLSVNRMVDVDV